MHTVLLVIHIMVTLALIAVILVQRSDNDGAILGGGGNSFMTGRSQANLLTRTTSILATVFIITSLLLTKFVAGPGGSIIDQIATPPAATQTTAPTAAGQTPAAPATAPEIPASPVTPTVPKPE